MFPGDQCGIPLIPTGQRGPNGPHLKEPGVDFDWAALDEGGATPEDWASLQNGGAVIRKLHHFIREHVIARRSGKVRSLKAIGARLVVLDYLLDPSVTHSLAHDARQLGISRAWSSTIAKEFAALTGLRPVRTNGDRSHIDQPRLGKESIKALATRR